jgi:L-lactate dehydrogenase complex protein LldG
VSSPSNGSETKRTDPSAREEILGRIRRALAGAPPASTGAAADIPRTYLPDHIGTDPTAAAPGNATAGTKLAELLAENLADYRARVHRLPAHADPATLIAALLAPTAHAPRRLRPRPALVVPDGVPASWIPAETELLRDRPPLGPAALDAADAVLTGCALAIAEIGTIVLDAGPSQGRRALTLLPDHHICVIRTADQIIASVPHALPRLDPDRPLTWIAGPSATSDIELDRVEGVHGPRRLDVVLLET